MSHPIPQAVRPTTCHCPVSDWQTYEQNQNVNSMPKNFLLNHEWIYTSGAPPSPSQVSLPISPPAQISPGLSWKSGCLAAGKAFFNLLLHSVRSG